MGNLFIKIPLIFVLFDITFCKKSGRSMILTEEEVNKFKFQPPSESEYDTVLKSAQEDTIFGEEQQDVLDVTHRDWAHIQFDRAGRGLDYYRWRYEMKIQIDVAYAEPERTAILSAIETLNRALPCFNFYIIPPEIDLYWHDYLVIQRTGTGCGSKIGRQGGRQNTTLPDVCFDRLYGNTLHELMHVLGFNHEQVRPDRDDWVTVNLEQADNETLSQYEKRTTLYSIWSVIQTTEYDYESILHFNFNDVLHLNPKSTKKPGSGFVVGQRDHLSKLDIAKLNLIYPCKEDGKTPAKHFG